MKTLTQIAVMALLPLAVLAEDASGPADVAPVRDCMRANLPTASSVQEIELRAVDRAGSERSLDAKISWRLDKDGNVQANVRVDTPPDLAGSSYLLLERENRDDLYMYLPAAQRSRRIVGGMMSQPVWGTDFSYEDVKRLQGVMDDGRVERLADTEIDGRPAFQLALTPAKAEESPYQRIVFAVDQETCLVSQIDFFDGGVEPAKRLVAAASSFVKQGDRWYPSMLKITDLRDESQTTMKVKKIEFDPELPSRLFSSQSYYRGN